MELNDDLYIKTLLWDGYGGVGEMVCHYLYGASKKTILPSKIAESLINTYCIRQKHLDFRTEKSHKAMNAVSGELRLVLFKTLEEVRHGHARNYDYGRIISEDINADLPPVQLSLLSCFAKIDIENVVVPGVIIGEENER